MKTIHDILKELAQPAISSRNKGDKFERLMEGYRWSSSLSSRA